MWFLGAFCPDGVSTIESFSWLSECRSGSGCAFCLIKQLNTRCPTKAIMIPLNFTLQNLHLGLFFTYNLTLVLVFYAHMNVGSAKHNVLHVSKYFSFTYGCLAIICRQSHKTKRK